MPKPFLKWAGGKASLLPQYADHIPTDFDFYHEPFLGGGAMFFHLCPDRAILGDTNARLINAYVQVRDNLDLVIEALSVHSEKHLSCPHGQDRNFSYYYRVRSEFNSRSGLDVAAAADLIYLNKTCFNGLYRENLKGQMNTPKGQTKNPPLICDIETLTACSKALNRSGVVLHCEDYESALQRVKATVLSFVFCDPPYVPIAEQKSNFSAYQAQPFGPIEQEDLEMRLSTLAKVGAIVRTSNSIAARGLYSQWGILEVVTRRSIAAKEGDRKLMTELLFCKN